MRTSTYIFFALLLGASAAGCEAFVSDYSDDPLAIPDAPAALRLTAAEASYIVYNEGDAARIAGMFADYFTGSDRQYQSYDSYNVTADNFNGIWEEAYAFVVAQLMIVEELAGETNQTTRGTARLLRAHTSGMTAALFGDVPFAQAGRLDSFPNPAYQPQADVYAGVQALLDQGIQDLQGSGNFAGDVFGLDAAGWTEVANTIKARFYSHTGNYEAAIEAALNGISAPANNLVAPHGPTVDGDQNLYFQFNTERGGYLTANGARAPELLQERGETGRYDYYYSGDVADAVLNTGTGGAFALDASFPIVTYAENQLILAEAYARTGDRASALEALNNVRSFNATTFGGTYTPYGDGDLAGDALLDEIITEKYLSLIGDIEGFNLARQYNNWQDPLGITPSSDRSSIPQRFLYSADELNANENAPDIVDLFAPTSVFAPTM